MKGLTTGASRHRILLYLAEHCERAQRHSDLARACGFRSVGSVQYHLNQLRAAGLVEKTPAGFLLAPGVVVSRNGFVGHVTTWLAA